MHRQARALVDLEHRCSAAHVAHGGGAAGLVPEHQALVVAAPVSLLGSVIVWKPEFASAPASAFSALLYLGLGSMFAGFWFWNTGLALGGIARVGQIQLLQPFMTFAGAALWMGEALDALNHFPAGE
mgnify:CR=1 FL=1